MSLSEARALWVATVLDLWVDGSITWGEMQAALGGVPR